MNIAFAGEKAFETFYEWTLTDKRIAKKIAELIRDIQRDPTGAGTGKPELLRGNLSGHYSRRITDEHRLVYKIDGDTIIITSCKGHYI
ncbi:Txe/YoeB family addiction module toxin [Treponema endosymbiont of Eucomonympha sp.]|uniref:Txe/YoeB family addiction module toxin n=1 Tax=Treponema endosymbiont of Eucomonympha sp. TaxID=1580831 RepID=UPI000750EC28|nr:Txe/YoeB family addiction module toxin [Treponema endosymbiont of Eucomonympha sp.]